MSGLHRSILNDAATKKGTIAAYLARFCLNSSDPIESLNNIAKAPGLYIDGGESIRIMYSSAVTILLRAQLSTKGN